MSLENVVFTQNSCGCTANEMTSFDYINLCQLDTSELLKAGEEKEAEITNTIIVPPVGRKKRRRARSCKNKEHAENQRVMHISVERNRRKLVNEYLAVIRSIMPPSYVRRNDQASIVDGAINFVKDLEQLLQTLNTDRQLNLISSPSSSKRTYTTTIAASGMEIHVTMVGRHVNLKVLMKRCPKQLLKMMLRLHSFSFNVLHLSVTTSNQMVLYTFSLKAEDDCHFTSADDIATAVHHMVVSFQDTELV